MESHARPGAAGEPFNYAAHLFETNASRAGKIAYIDDRGTLTYGELAQRSRRFAAALLAAGIRREERVLLVAHDTSEWPVAFLGAMYAGVVPVALNTLLTAADYAYVLGTAGPAPRSFPRRWCPSFPRRWRSGPTSSRPWW